MRGAAPMREGRRAFLTRAGAYTLTPLPAMLRLATRAPGLGAPPGARKIYRRGEGLPDRDTKARRAVLGVLEDYGGLAFTLKELAEMAGVSPSVVKGLAAQGVVREEEAPRDTPYLPLDPARPGKTLTTDQMTAVAHLHTAAGQGYSTTLLRGVTGSGKTEVYLEAVADCLRRGRQALVLLPEIALTQEFLTRVEARFGAKPAEWHSGITQTERRRCWKMVGEGGAQMVVGARSALFLPFRDLGLIVVDEEHDTSYKQEEGVLYNARDMAVLRASICGAQVVLASATPSLESWANAEAGKYTRVELTSRFGPAVMPTMGAIDMRSEGLPSDKWVSPTLKVEVDKRLERGEQAMLFINRRGYAPVTLCRACGHQIGCDHCDARMVEHRYLKRLVCHQCGESKPMPEVCPSCEVEGKLAAVGPGVERLGEEAAALWPEARVATLSSDMYGSARALKSEIAGIADGAADIIIGTQLVAKGHNFPNLTLVGVIDADLGLMGSDLRAAERVYQQIAQVAGRAGRASKPGEVLIQTRHPEAPVIAALAEGDRDAFYAAELEARRHANAPPFGRWAAIIVSSEDADEAAQTARLIGKSAPVIEGMRVYGPAPAPLAVLRGRHRHRLLIHASRQVDIQAAIREWLGNLAWKSGTRVAVDVDPYSFM